MTLHFFWIKSCRMASKIGKCLLGWGEIMLKDLLQKIEWEMFNCWYSAQVSKFTFCNFSDHSQQFLWITWLLTKKGVGLQNGRFWCSCDFSRGKCAGCGQGWAHRAQLKRQGRAWRTGTGFCSPRLHQQCPATVLGWGGLFQPRGKI